MRRSGRPASPTPVLPAFPVPPVTGPASGTGAGAHPAGHAAAGLPALATVTGGTATRIPARYRADWAALLRDRRGPHRPG